MASSGCRLIAVELSETTAEICRERTHGAAEVIVGNIETGEGLDGLEVDAIVGVSVLHHVNLELCFSEAFRCLRAGGRFAFCEPNMANPQIWLERHVELVKRLRHVTPHETAFRAAELRRSFERAGFDVEIAESFEFLHPSTPEFAIPLVSRLEALLERTPINGIAGSVRVAGSRP